MGVSQVGFDEGKGKLQGYGGLSKQEVLELEAWHSEPASGSGQQEEKRKQKQKQKNYEESMRNLCQMKILFRKVTELTAPAK